MGDAVVLNLKNLKSLTTQTAAPHLLLASHQAQILQEAQVGVAARTAHKRVIVAHPKGLMAQAIGIALSLVLSGILLKQIPQQAIRKWELAHLHLLLHLAVSGIPAKAHSQQQHSKTAANGNLRAAVNGALHQALPLLNMVKASGIQRNQAQVHNMVAARGIQLNQAQVRNMVAAASGVQLNQAQVHNMVAASGVIKVI